MLMMILEDNSTDNELLARGQQAGLIEKKNWTHQEPSWNQIHWNSKYRWASNYQTQCDQLTNDEGNDTNFRFGQFFVRCMQHQPQSLVVSVLNHSLLLSTTSTLGQNNHWGWVWATSYKLNPLSWCQKSVEIPSQISLPDESHLLFNPGITSTITHHFNPI